MRVDHESSEPAIIHIVSTRKCVGRETACVDLLHGWRETEWADRDRPFTAGGRKLLLIQRLRKYDSVGLNETLSGLAISRKRPVSRNMQLFTKWSAAANVARVCLDRAASALILR